MILEWCEAGKGPEVGHPTEDFQVKDSMKERDTLGGEQVSISRAKKRDKKPPKAVSQAALRNMKHNLLSCGMRILIWIFFVNRQ